MGAASVTGIGTGVANKPTINELSTLGNGPIILLTGMVNSQEIEGEETYGATITFPTPLPGVTNNPGDEYCVILTTHSGTYATVTDLDDHDLNNDGEDDHL